MSREEFLAEGGAPRLGKRGMAKYGAGMLGSLIGHLIGTLAGKIIATAVVAVIAGAGLLHAVSSVPTPSKIVGARQHATISTSAVMTSLGESRMPTW